MTLEFTLNDIPPTRFGLANDRFNYELLKTNYQRDHNLSEVPQPVEVPANERRRIASLDKSCVRSYRCGSYEFVSNPDEAEITLTFPGIDGEPHGYALKYNIIRE